eukprot:CAMPEP_0170391964 /NCGR_PEP_ID=MMETSP0117_2-20130122/19942_1 /TAXON_ID=400756 /ORGANISM="Durinskia baltica, Strain CSIRO CS-38" /LENGTH=182 /DNA_ID=CAMNT_0010648075 /DNA_START=358 /DNA_END=903 /DNA_ORIENTATION=-
MRLWETRMTARQPRTLKIRRSENASTGGAAVDLKRPSIGTNSDNNEACQSCPTALKPLNPFGLLLQIVDQLLEVCDDAVVHHFVAACLALQTPARHCRSELLRLRPQPRDLHRCQDSRKDRAMEVQNARSITTDGLTDQCTAAAPYELGERLPPLCAEIPGIARHLGWAKRAGANSYSVHGG